jgi:hypothetical protein
MTVTAPSGQAPQAKHPDGALGSALVHAELWHRPPQIGPQPRGDVAAIGFMRTASRSGSLARPENWFKIQRSVGPANGAVRRSVPVAILVLHPPRW